MSEITVTDILEEVVEDICDNICKYLAEANERGTSQKELDRHCVERPLRRLA